MKQSDLEAAVDAIEELQELLDKRHLLHCGFEPTSATIVLKSETMVKTKALVVDLTISDGLELADRVLFDSIQAQRAKLEAMGINIILDDE